MERSFIDWLAWILVVVGAINWGLVAIFNWNLVDVIFGAATTVSTIVYILVGVAGLWMIYAFLKN